MKSRSALTAILALALTLCLGIGSVSAQVTLTPMERLGKKLFHDPNLSANQNQSCSSCHLRGAGWVDPANIADPFSSFVSTGSDGISKGGRQAPTAAYAGFSPPLTFNEIDGVWEGGLFWDGRATGLTPELGDPLAEQARGPFLNPIEMMMPDKAAVVAAVEASTYAQLFRRVFGLFAFTDVDADYDNIARAIAAYERSGEVIRFSSKFDDFWRACQAANPQIDVSTIGTLAGPAPDDPSLPQGILNPRELKGLALFNDDARGKCALCHLTTNSADPNTGAPQPPLFTDFTYDNLGVPQNPLLAAAPVDNGLGDFLRTAAGAALIPAGQTDAEAAANDGKVKVPTLRNVGISAPYTHNGYFPTLTEVVKFYNTRDVLMQGAVSAWPPADQPVNVNTAELGNLGLTVDEEWDIVAFLFTLTDNLRNH